MENKKNIMFVVPLRIIQSVKIPGTLEKKWSWNVPLRLKRALRRLLNFIVGLFPRYEEVEVGAKRLPLGEVYLGLDDNGNLTQKSLPEVNEQTEVLIKRIGIAIEMVDSPSIPTDNSVTTYTGLYTTLM